MGLNIAGLLSGGAAKLVEAVGSALDKNITNKEEKAAAALLLTQEINKHLEALATTTAHQYELELKDLDSARNMQVEALKQGDTFSKRFIYYLAIVVIFMVFSFDMCMFFAQYPAENRDMINQTSGVLNSGALIMVLAFFYGSSQGSKDSAKRMESLVHKAVEKK